MNDMEWNILDVNVRFYLIKIVCEKLFDAAYNKQKSESKQILWYNNNESMNFIQ